MAQRLRQVALVLLLGIAPLALLEGGLRLAGWPTQRVRTFSKLINFDPAVWHETIGVFRPHARSTVLWPPELSYVVHVNALGLRGPEIERTPPPGHTRILALGDSMTFGYYLEEEETWPAQLERLLRDGGANVEVVNAGSGGWSIESETLFLLERGLALEPHHVVVAFCANDIADLERPVPVYEATRRGATGRGGELRRALYTSAIYELYLRGAVAWRHWREQRLGVEHRPLSSMDVPEERAEALWNEYAGWLDRMQQALEEHGASLTLVYLPDVYKLANGIPAHDEARLRALARERGLGFVSPLRAFEGRGEAELFHRPYDDHLNAAGALLVARALADTFGERLLAGADPARPSQ